MATLVAQHMMAAEADNLSTPLLERRSNTSPGKSAPEEEELGMSDKTVHKTGCRREVWLFLHGEVAETGFRRLARRYEFFSVSLVIYLVTQDIVLSIPALIEIKRSALVFHIELGVYMIFTTEYLSRMWSCMADKELHDLGPIKGRVKLGSGVMNVVDLLVCTAYFINFLPGFEQLQGMGALRMIRLLRVAALLKVERKTNSFGKILMVFTTKKLELLSTVFMAGVLMVMSAAVMFYIETDAQPVKFGSIPASLWWSVTALTTVGYGDVYPMTSQGKLTACMIAFFGVGIFALPAGILGEGFMEAMEKPGHAEMDQMCTELTGSMNRKEEKAKEVKLGIEGIHRKVERVQKDQQKILKLLQAFTPVLVQSQAGAGSRPMAEQALIHRDFPSTFPGALPTLSFGGSGLASHCASLGEQDLASLQDRVEQKLNELTSSMKARSPTKGKSQFAQSRQ